MNFNYEKLLENLNVRRFGQKQYQQILNEEKSTRFADSADKKDFSNSMQYLSLSESTTIKYIIGAMSSVSENYTQQIIAKRKSVENVITQLNKEIYSQAPLEFRGQGSVTNNTHIKMYSDIDLLVIIGKYISLEPGLPNENPYKGDPCADLIELRENCKWILTKNTNMCIEDDGGKCLKLSGGSLIVTMDIVPVNWYDTVEFKKTNYDIFRGVQVYDKGKGLRILNFPFQFNELLKEKDSRTAGVFKQAVRLLKSFKADYEELENNKIKFSSYGISSLLYAVNETEYHIGMSPLKLIEIIQKQLSRYLIQENFEKLRDPLGEKLAANNTIEGLRELQSVVQKVLNDILFETNLDKKIRIVS